MPWVASLNLVAYRPGVPRHHQIGWGLFLASALLFGWAGIRSGDWLVVVASVVFGAGCVLFLVESK